MGNKTRIESPVKWSFIQFTSKDVFCFQANISEERAECASPNQASDMSFWFDLKYHQATKHDKHQKGSMKGSWKMVDIWSLLHSFALSGLETISLPGSLIVLAWFGSHTEAAFRLRHPGWLKVVKKCFRRWVNWWFQYAKNFGLFLNGRFLCGWLLTPHVSMFFTFQSALFPAFLIRCKAIHQKPGKIWRCFTCDVRILTREKHVLNHHPESSVR